MSDLISFDQLRNQIADLRDKTDALGCRVNDYQDALSRAIDVINNQEPITKSNVPEEFKNSDKDNSAHPIVTMSQEEFNSFRTDATEDYSNSFIVIPDTAFATDTKVSKIVPMSFPTELIPLQCTSCGAAIDKDTMTCKHCGMTFMLK